MQETREEREEKKEEQKERQEEEKEQQIFFLVQFLLYPPRIPMIVTVARINSIKLIITYFITKY